MDKKRGKVISKDGDTNYKARCLMVSLLLLIACDITSCSFHSWGFILSSIQHRQWNCSICYEPDTKRLIMARLSVIWNFPVSRGFWHSQQWRWHQPPILTEYWMTYVSAAHAAFVGEHANVTACSDYRDELSSALYTCALNCFYPPFPFHVVFSHFLIPGINTCTHTHTHHWSLFLSPSDQTLAR